MRRDNLTVIVLALAAVFSVVAALAARAAHSPARLPPQSVMPIGELTDAAAKDLPIAPFGPFTSP